MGEIQVNFEALQSGRTGIAQTFKRLQATLDELEAGLKPMIETWSGSAQDQYMMCKRQWDDAAVALATVLNEVSTAVGTAHENYSSTHSATVQIWS